MTLNTLVDEESEESDTNPFVDATIVIYSFDLDDVGFEPDDHLLTEELGLAGLTLWAQLDDTIEIPMFIRSGGSCWFSMDRSFSRESEEHVVSDSFVETVARLPDTRDDGAGWMRPPESAWNNCTNIEQLVVVELRNAITSQRAPPEAYAMLEAFRERLGLSSSELTTNGPRDSSSVPTDDE